MVDRAKGNKLLGGHREVDDDTRKREWDAAQSLAIEYAPVQPG